jgi:CheY-like chemotaxis protein
MAEAKILIVDDDQDIRRLLAHRLKNEGFETAFAGDAINAARKTEPDLILLDVGLPAGDRRVAIERMKAIRRSRGSR